MGWITLRKTKAMKNSIYYYFWKDKSGRLHSKSLKTDSKIEAKKKMLFLEVQLQSSKKLDIDDNDDITIEYAIDKLIRKKRTQIKDSTYNRYLDYKKHILNFFKLQNIRKIKNINIEVVNEYQYYRKKDGAAGNTINKETRCLRQAIEYLYELDMIDKILVKKWPRLKEIPVRPERIGYYTIPELQKMKTFFSENIPDFFDYFLFLVYTGARKGEVEQLKVHNIMLDEGYLKLRNFKTATNAENLYRTIPIHEELTEILKKRIENKNFEDNVFDEWKTHASNWFNRNIKIACRECNIQYKRVHGTRHTFGSLFHISGATEREVQEILGHTDGATTRKYLHTNIEMLKQKMSNFKI